jgi:hypothetical protein
MERDEQQLDRIFADYKTACPSPEISAGFMPGLWRRIDTKRGFYVALRRWTRAIVTAVAAACIAMLAYMAGPDEEYSPVFTTTYVDTLDQTETFETLAYSDVVHFEFAPVAEPR